MSKLTQTNVFPVSQSKAETPMEKTTRAVREILDADTEQRQIKTARLRKARRESEANPVAEVIGPATNGVRKTPGGKAST
ncbi:hypothetical protein SAMN05216227_10534 [Pseudorhodobacter antarcticus]|uniref:Uncharacterized protein n=1 Tax=Pseudorhodobacter antarcticus TaxID=1077947 RepID=A0A1H8MC38_9RHOB|nr:hypothetical protein [Pseudorhodobacter antarcticus]SEO14863.1 hypothetical protein SAMN05216227_10534 [Pseudorhodobacter antarcticus]